MCSTCWPCLDAMRRRRRRRCGSRWLASIRRCGRSVSRACRPSCSDWWMARWRPSAYGCCMPSTVPIMAPKGCGVCCWQSSAICAWCLSCWRGNWRACVRPARCLMPHANRLRFSPRTSMRRWPIAWVSGSSSGSSKISPSATCTPRYTSASLGCSTSAAATARNSSASRSMCCTVRWMPPAFALSWLAVRSTSIRSGRKCSASRWSFPISMTFAPCAYWSTTWPIAMAHSAWCIRCGRICPANSTTTSHDPRATTTVRCIRQWSDRAARRWKCRSARTRCIAPTSWVWRHTGATRRAAAATASSRRKLHGCAVCSSRARTVTAIWPRSCRPSCWKTASTYSRPRAKWWICRTAPPCSTLPITCIRKWVTAAAALRSTAASCRLLSSRIAAIAWKC